MNNTVLVGRKVIHNKYGDGTIVAMDSDYISVDFNGEIKKFSVEFFERFFRYEDEETRALVMKMLQEIKDKKAEEIAKKVAEEKKRLAEIERQAEAKRHAEDKKDDAEKRNRPVHPYIDERRNNEKHAIFLVCQNNNFQVESEGGFIWAPTHIDKGEAEIASHEEMDYVKKGDIIFHHFSNHIYAISVARADCSLQMPSSKHPDAGKIGRCVELSYHILKNPADTSSLQAEKAKYGSMKYGPFTKNGHNKQGFYLSELHEHLATIFIDAAIAANPGDLTLLDIKNEI